MNRAFTLIELLVVIGIMGLMGTAAVGGYRQMRIGMEQKGVVDNVDQFLDTCFRRAQIDRQPVFVYLWNELVQEKRQDGSASVKMVGKAVAVRRLGRTSAGGGNMIIDEFGDFDLIYRNAGTGASRDSGGVKIYQVNSLAADVAPAFSVVEPAQYVKSEAGSFAFGEPKGGNGIPRAYLRILTNAGGNQWGRTATWSKPGIAYGMEFARITLPDNYLFSQDLPESSSSPVTKAVTKVMKVDGTFSSKEVPIYAMRPGSDGRLAARRIGAAPKNTLKVMRDGGKKS